jgi:hypothetical protein
MGIKTIVISLNDMDNLDHLLTTCSLDLPLVLTIATRLRVCTKLQL